MDEEAKKGAPAETEGVQKPMTTENLLIKLGSFLQTLTGSVVDEQAQDLRALVSELQSAAQVNEALDEANREAESTSEIDAPTWIDKDVLNLLVIRGDKYNDQLWEITPRVIDRNGKKFVEVNFEMGSNILKPGSKKEDQGIDLAPIECVFTMDEWNVLVKPIMQRYLDVLRLDKMNRFADLNSKNVRERLQRILPNVFPKNDSKKAAQDILNSKGGEIHKKIYEIVSQVNMDPDVLRGWIKTILEDADKEKKIDGVTINNMSKTARAYFSLRHGFKKGRLNRLRKGKTEEQTESAQEKAFEDDLLERISSVGEQLLMLNRRYPDGVKKVDRQKADFKETPHMKRMLKDLADRAARQIKGKKGIINLIGDMGVGKNYLAEYFAARTKRPFFFFPCSRGMDPADLAYHFELKAGESIKFPSALARGLLTKNAVILIDEPNALPPEVIASLHGVGDHNRAFVYNGTEYKAAEGVVIMFAMNPAGYAHVKSLPEATSDRTLGQDMYVDYPPLTKLDEVAMIGRLNEAEKQKELNDNNTLDKEFVCDEALILKDEFPEMKNISDEDFEKLWDVVNNSKGVNLLGEHADFVKKYSRQVKAILAILKVCQKWRSEAKKENMQRTISLRGSTTVAGEYALTPDVRKAFLSVFQGMPGKYDTGIGDYELLQKMLNDMVAEIGTDVIKESLAA